MKRCAEPAARLGVSRQRHAENVAGFLLHGMAVLRRTNPQTLLEILSDVADDDAGHGHGPPCGPGPSAAPSR